MERPRHSSLWGQGPTTSISVSGNRYKMWAQWVFVKCQNERKQCSHSLIKEESVSSKVGSACSSLCPSSLHANKVRNPGQKLNLHLKIKWDPIFTGRTWAWSNAWKIVCVSISQILKIQMPSPLITKNSWASLFYCISHYFWFQSKLHLSCEKH